MHRCRKIMLHEFYSTSCWTEGIVIDATYGLDGNGIVLRPQAEALIDVLCQDVLPARRRPGVRRPDSSPDGRRPQVSYKNPDKAREHDRERYRRLTKERLAQGLCPKCGREPLPPDCSLCRSCGEKRRKAERARYAKGKAAGRLYGGRDPKDCRRLGRERSRKRLRACRAAGLCTRCGNRPPVPGGATCRACRDARQAAEQEQYAARRAEGRCGRCGRHILDHASRCGPCAALEAGRHPRKNAASRRRYAHRRARWRCTDCGEPSQGAARCVPCAHRSWVRSGWHRGLPILPPRYTVIEVATGEDHGIWDSWEEVAMCLAFARLSHQQVEIISDTSPMASFTGQ